MSLQDVGRPGYRRYGVPPGGWFDSSSSALANALLDQPAELSVIEIAGTVAFTAIEGGWLALTGADSRCLINNEDCPGQSRFLVRAGDFVQVQPATTGIRVYLAAPGGWVGEPVLASVSGQMISRNAIVASKTDLSFSASMRLAQLPESVSTKRLCFIGLSEAPEFNGGPFLVSPTLDRVGIRLSGQPPPSTELVRSEPCTPGVIQAPGGDQILIHGPDGPTLGGYGRLGCVISAHLCRLGQLRPDDEVNLVRVEYEEARRLCHSEGDTLKAHLANVRLMAGQENR